MSKLEDKIVAVTVSKTEPVIVEVERMLEFFKYKHLPEHLQLISKPFCELAEKMVNEIPRNPERTVMLRKLLESKDCAVRAALI